MRQLPPIPKHLNWRPLDQRGYPIPYTVARRPDGNPDFRIIDAEKSRSCAAARRCAVCGRPMGRHIAFIGGPLCHVNRYFLDGPMHRDCALFSVRTCPHIVLSKAQYRMADRQVADGLTLVDHELGDKPEVFMLGMTTKYDILDHNGSPLYRAAPWESVTWWRDGGETEPPI